MLLSFGFAAFFAGIIGTVTLFSMPGSQPALGAISGTLTGSGFAALLITFIINIFPLTD